MTEKSIFHQSIVLFLSPSSLVGRPMDGQSQIDDRLLHFLSTIFPQSESPFTMDERTAICYTGGSSQVVEPCQSSLQCTFRPFLVLSIPLLLQSPLCDCRNRCAEHDNSLIHSIVLLEPHDPHFFRHPPSLPSLYLLQPAPSRGGARGNGL